MAPFFSHNEFETGWDSETGKPGIALVSSAIRFWTVQQGGTASVPAIAAAFNMAEDDVRLALEWPRADAIVADEEADA